LCLCAGALLGPPDSDIPKARLNAENREISMKRAITLAGGGPAAGLHIGVLKRLAEEKDITFDVWALSCIGAWVGLVYNQYDPDQDRKAAANKTYDFFKKGIFRDDRTYSRFPINSVFGPDWVANTKSLMSFLTNPDTYDKLFLPEKIWEAYGETLRFMFDHRRWTEGDFNQLLLNHGLAVNPYVRFLTSMMYLSEVSGLARIHYPDSTFMKGIDFGKINQADPFIFHNAYNLTKNELTLFCNKDERYWRERRRQPTSDYQQISPASLCACSALPYIEQTVKIGKDTYCEGALVDTVNFQNLIEDHPDLDEIWISRIVDHKQIREPRNLTDALANLCQLFAATVGDDDVKLFKYHVQTEKSWSGTIVEIQVSQKISFEWSHSNLDLGVQLGADAAGAACKAYKKALQDRQGDPKKTGEVRIIDAKTPAGKPPVPQLREVA